MIRYIYSGDERVVINNIDLELLFQIYILADKVMTWSLITSVKAFVTLEVFRIEDAELVLRSS
jgi:hypothetical protein